MENQQPPPQSTSLCRANCGFYGSPATEDFCSKCFKDSIKRKQETTQRLSPNSINMVAASTSIAASMTTTDLEMSNVPTPKIEVSVSPMLTETEEKHETPSSLPVVNILSSSSSTASLVSDTGSESGTSATRPKKPNRCHVCNKRVGLTGFTCRCEGLFCGEHRYDNKHDCPFDYKTMEREELRKNNPVIKSEKIQRIWEAMWVVSVTGLGGNIRENGWLYLPILIFLRWTSFPNIQMFQNALYLAWLKYKFFHYDDACC